MSANNPSLLDLRKKIEEIQDKTLRISLMYMYLIGGTPSEVYGDNRPRGKDPITTRLQIYEKHYDVILFPVKTARLNTVRICALPLNPEIEPWTKNVYDWFQEMGEDPPFQYALLKSKPTSHQREAIRTIADEFENWSIDQGGYYKNSRLQPVKNAGFRARHIREYRRRSLREFYGFSDADLARFGAWNERPREVNARIEIQKIYSTSIDKNNLKDMLDYVNIYLSKLLRPIDELGSNKPISIQINNYSDFKQRVENALKCVELIDHININFEGKYGIEFIHQDNTKLTVEMISPCQNEQNIFISKLTNLATLFETNFDKIIKDYSLDRKLRNFDVIRTLLKIKNIEYNSTMITTWQNIKDLRNCFVHYDQRPQKMFQIFRYFNLPEYFPPNYERLWDAILNEFITSIEEWNDILKRM